MLSTFVKVCSEISTILCFMIWCNGWFLFVGDLTGQTGGICCMIDTCGNSYHVALLSCLFACCCVVVDPNIHRRFSPSFAK